MNAGQEGVTVLIADDDDDIRSLVAIPLERDGYRVLTAVDGEQALEVALTQLPDLAVLDVTMPRSDGYEVARMLKTYEATRSMPIILLTARVRDDDVERAFQAGADDYVAKPFSPRELRGRVRAMVARTASVSPG